MMVALREREKKKKERVEEGKEHNFDGVSIVLIFNVTEIELLSFSELTR